MSPEAHADETHGGEALSQEETHGGTESAEARLSAKGRPTEAAAAAIWDDWTWE